MPETEHKGVDFVDEAEATYFAEARLGQQTLEFLHSPVGRLLHGRALNVVDQAKEDLLDIDVETKEGRKQFKEVKTIVQHAQWFMRWCADAIENGRESEVQLNEYRD